MAYGLDIIKKVRGQLTALLTPRVNILNPQNDDKELQE
jgi:hypothetical protein